MLDVAEPVWLVSNKQLPPHRHPAINIAQAHDVVFPHILAALHLDHYQINRPGIDQAVSPARFDKGRFVGVELKLAVAIGHLRDAAHHNPVLAALAVHLQGQRALGLDHDTFDFEPRPFFEHRISAPRPCDCTVQAIGVVALQLERLGDVFNILATLGIRDQQRIGGVNDDQFIEPDPADQTFGALM